MEQPSFDLTQCPSRRRKCRVRVVLFGTPLLLAAISFTIIWFAEFSYTIWPGAWPLARELRAYMSTFNMIGSTAVACVGGFLMCRHLWQRIAAMIAGGAYGLAVSVFAVALTTWLIL